MGIQNKANKRAMRAKIKTGTFNEIASEVVLVVGAGVGVGPGVTVGAGVGVGTGKKPLGSRKVLTVKMTPLVVTKSALIIFPAFGFPADETVPVVPVEVMITPPAWYAVAVVKALDGKAAKKAGKEKLRRWFKQNALTVD